MPSALWQTARPKQWLKNVLVFVAPGAAGVIGDWQRVAPTLLAFLSLCLVASGSYCWNDAVDAEADRAHPVKSARPVAAGALSVAAAKIAGATCIAAGLAMATVAGWRCVAAVGGYALLTAVYSAWAKHHAVIDLVAIATGFVLRAAAGALAAGVPMSSWFLLYTSCASLFIVAGKRFAELRTLGPAAATARSSLAVYSVDYLRTVIAVSLGATLVAYCLWAFNAKSGVGSTWPFYELSVAPMLVALLRYLLVLESGGGGAPEEVFLTDRYLQAAGGLWVVCFTLGVYL